jgi:3-oxoacyl-[acyl-carrier protein] reductase
MQLELSGRIAAVTGSSAGIGFAIASALAREGCSVVLNGRDPERLDVARAALGAAGAVACDVAKEEGAARLVKYIEDGYGRLDVLVCNVGSGRSVPAFQESEAEWRRMMDVNLLSTTLVVAACRTLLSASRGAIVCVSSICGLEALGCPLAYAAAKAALNHYVHIAARPLARHGIRITAVAPGNILFPGSVWERKLAEDRGAVESMLAKEVALGRLGSAEEIADWVAFLASPRAAFATGSVHVVDGGQVRS